MSKQAPYGKPCESTGWFGTLHLNREGDRKVEYLVGADFSPESIAAYKAYDRLSDPEKLAVRLRYGRNVYQWWRGLTETRISGM